MPRLLAALALTSLTGCLGSSPWTHGPVQYADGGEDAGADAGRGDAGRADGGRSDAGVDAGADAGWRCSSAADCPSGEQCDAQTGACYCPTGSHFCWSACVPEDTSNCGNLCVTCTAPANATASCNAGTCGYTCDPGFHACGAECVVDSAQHCGPACSSCLGAPNAVPTCVQGACGLACASGYHLCGASCVPETAQSCGPSCAACAPGSACSAGQCVATCPNGSGFRTLVPDVLLPGASSVGVADMNGDGRPDLVTVSAAGVSIALGGPLGFAAPVVKSTGFGLAYYGDVDGDGVMDVVLLGYGYNSSAPVVTLRGDGAGGFKPELVSAFTAAGLDVTAADANHDGKIDLFVRENGGAVSLLVGNGDGTFNAPTTIPLPGATAFIAVADFNKDGDADVAAVPVQANGLYLALSDGAGGYAQSTVAPATTERSLAAGDADGDGVADLVAADITGVLTLLHGNGDGTFTGTRTASYASVSPAYPGPMSIADLDGDGKPDVLVSWGLEVFLDAPALPVLPSATYPSDGPFLVADATGDGRPDVVFVGRDRIAILAGQPGGTLGLPVRSTMPRSSEAALADMDGDGRADLVLSTSAGWSVFLSDGTGRFPTNTANATACNGYFLVGDVNGDGRPDLVGNGCDLLNAGGGLLSAPVKFYAPFVPAVLVDLDRDGVLDVAGTTFQSPSMHVEACYGRGDGTFGPPVALFDPPAPATALAVGDVDGDGLPDFGVLAWASSLSANSVQVTLARPGGYAAEPALTQPNATAIALADLSGDGRADGIFGTSQGSTLSFRVADATGQLGPSGDETGMGTMPIALGDLDGDGLLDVVAPEAGLQTSGRVWTRFSATGGGARDAQKWRALPSPTWSAVGDVDGDGRLDVVVGDDNGDIATLFGSCR